MLKPVLAGIVSALVGFAGAFAVVLAGLRGAGADEAQAASGLLAVCLACGIVAAVLGLRTRMPVVIAWSTPGAALLVTTGPQPGGFAAAVGAFLVCGALIVLAGLVPALSRLVAAIPQAVAGAMLAGVLLPLCLAPVRALVEIPLLAAPVVAVWAVLARLARPWAVPAALAVAVALIVATGPVDLGAPPALVWTAPVFDPAAIVAIGLPLFLVTMASQNVPGMAVLAQFGYRPDLRPVLVTTGLGTLASAPFGGHAVNLAAISAALAAGPEAGAPERRWIAGVTNGVALALLGLGAGVATALVLAAPPVLIEAVAGLALLGALAAALSSALAEPSALADADGREAAIITFVVTAGTGSAMWGLVAGAVITALYARPRRTSSGPISGSRPRKAR